MQSVSHTLQGRRDEGTKNAKKTMLVTFVSSSLRPFVPCKLCLKPKPGDGENGTPSRRSRRQALALFFFASFFFWYPIVAFPDWKNFNLIYGKMIFQGSSLENHGRWQRSGPLSIKLVTKVARHLPLPCFRRPNITVRGLSSAFLQEWSRSTAPQLNPRRRLCKIKK